MKIQPSVPFDHQLVEGLRAKNSILRQAQDAGVVRPDAGVTKQDAAGRDDPALRKACREFEAFLVAQLIKNMRASMPKADLFGSAQKEEIFQSMLDEEVAKEISKTSALRLGDMIYVQLATPKTAKVSGEAVE